MTPPLQAVAFDLDSTLSEYALTVEEVLERAVPRAGFAADAFGPLDRLAADYNSAWWTAEEVLRVPTDELRRRAWTTILDDRGIADEATARRLADAYSDVRKETGFHLFDGVPAFLSDLRTRYRVGILTNGPSDMQWGKLRVLELTDAVDAIVVAGDLGIFKPDPRPFRQILDRLDAAPDAALYVGNSYEHDIVGAHGAGMRTAWVTANGAGETMEITPDHVVRRVTDLREALL